MPASLDMITLRRPDDWHVHLRDGEMLKAVVPFTARQFARAIVMPNLATPVTTVAAALAYRERIIAALRSPPDALAPSLPSPASGGGPGWGHVQEGTAAGFSPLMTCYLTDRTAPEEVACGYREGVFAAVKLYPARATTNSAFG